MVERYNCLKNIVSCFVPCSVFLNRYRAGISHFLVKDYSLRKFAIFFQFSEMRRFVE